MVAMAARKILAAMATVFVFVAGRERQVVESQHSIS